MYDERDARSEYERNEVTNTFGADRFLILQKEKKAGEEEVEKTNLCKLAQLSHGLLPFALSLLSTFYNIHNRREGSTSVREVFGAMERASKEDGDRAPILSYSSRRSLSRYVHVSLRTIQSAIRHIFWKGLPVCGRVLVKGDGIEVSI